MEYKLIKELRDADFPISGGIYHSFDAEERIWPSPTLSELIEACGDKFENLTFYANEWIANADYSGGDVADGIKGKSSIEAVANLWLVLNKK